MSRTSSLDNSPFRVFLSSVEKTSNFFLDASFSGLSNTASMCLTCSWQILPTSSAQSDHSLRLPTFLTILARISSSKIMSRPKESSICLGPSPFRFLECLRLIPPTFPPVAAFLVNFLSVRQMTSSFSELIVFNCPSTIEPKSSSIDFKARRTCQTV